VYCHRWRRLVREGRDYTGTDARRRHSVRHARELTIMSDAVSPTVLPPPWKVSPWWWLLRLTQCCRAITRCSAFLGPAVNWWPFSAIAACSSPSVYRREVGVLSFHFVHYSGYPGFGNGVSQEVWVGTITLYCGPMAKPRYPSEARETNSLHRSSNHLQIICLYNHL